MKAFLFDLNGTMINDMQYHIEAWHRILNELGANLSQERVKQECYGKNDELLERIFPGRFTDEEKARMSMEKERAYQRAFKPNLELIDGLEDFLKQAHKAGVKMGICSAAITFNIDFVLDGTGTRAYFDAVVSADDVSESKPHPETFLKAAEILHMEPVDCIVFEDVPKGVESASNAGMEAVVITTMHRPDEFKDFTNVIRFAKDYTELLDLVPKPLPAHK